MDCLVIGCGYLGGRVAARWSAQGRRVSALTRSPEHAEALRGQGLEPIVGDVLSPESLRPLPRAATVLYAVSHDRAAAASMRQVHVDGLANVLDHLPAPQRFLYVSSNSVYGQTDGEWVDETSPTTPREESGRIVLEAENLLRRRLPEALILRFAGIYGPGRLLREKTLRAGEPIVGDGEKWLNLIHVEDGAGAVLTAEERGEPAEVYNICDDRPVRRREFYQELARLLGAPPVLFRAPAADQPTPPHEQAHRRISNRRMKNELGVRLTFPSFREGLVASV